jgi:hypothetical protein
MTPMWKAAKNIHLLLNKIRHVQIVEEDNYKKTYLSNWFLQAIHDSILDPKL